MDKEWKTIASRLPVQPCGDLVNDVMSDIYDAHALGMPLLLYHREAVTLREEIQDSMNPEDWERRERTAKHRWGARCTCSNCGDDFIAGYVKGGGIVLAEGEDGQTYDGYVEEGPDTIVCQDGDMLICPVCYTSVELTPRSQLRRGRTIQALQAEVVNVEAYTVVMYYLVSRRLDDTGGDCTLFLPHAALLIDREGKLRRFRAKRLGNEVTDVAWLPCASTRDPMQISYYSWEAENHQKIGGWTFDYGPDLEGHTGEKTALDKYIGAGGSWPGAYLHVWAKHPQVENLMRQGFAETVKDAIDRPLEDACYRQNLCDAPPISWVDWREVKPHRMLHMSKVAFRVIREADWTAADLECWDRYQQQIPLADALDFAYCRERIGSKAVGQLLEMVAAGWEDLTPLRVTRYLEKQQCLEDGTQLLIDYRKMLRDAELDEGREACWPRDLTAAHERMTEYWSSRTKQTYQAGFTSTFIRLRPLEWTDGELCVVVPRVESDLAEEGKVLRHCVGTYGSSHCSNKPIFFIRHRRRPERSYYTLQMDLTLRRPKEIQLHGYGNERHGENKQYKHGIPRKVREFCDRWEREVLTPWFAAQQAPQERAVPAAGRKRRTA